MNKLEIEISGDAPFTLGQAIVLMLCMAAIYFALNVLSVLVAIHGQPSIACGLIGVVVWIFIVADLNLKRRSDPLLVTVTRVIHSIIMAATLLASAVTLWERGLL